MRRIACVLTMLMSVLVSAPAMALEKVYFYCTDPAGTPVAMTNDNGAVVWRAEYKPFGETSEESGPTPNKKKFVGKELDTESGLYYFVARYMESRIGRFTSADSIGAVNVHTGTTNYGMLADPQSLNYYVYSLNNPYKYVDHNGQWPASISLAVHQTAINRALPQVSHLDKRVLYQQQVVMDRDQSGENAYQHAMRGESQNALGAWRDANDFVYNEMTAARSLEAKGSHEQALVRLGNAMHTVQDSTCPPHSGFQIWYEHWNPGDIWEKSVHLSGEQFDPGPGSELYRVTGKMWEIFKSKDPIPKAMIRRPQ